MVVMRMVTFLIELAPWGVFALLAKLSATGVCGHLDLAAYFFTLLGALIFQALVVYGVAFPNAACAKHPSPKNAKSSFGFRRLRRA